MKDFVGRHILFLVENCSVPTDHRPWKEAKVAKRMGFDVSVVSPKGTVVDLEGHAVIDGIEIHRYKPRVLGIGFLSYAIEYLNALVMSSYLIIKIALRKRIDVFHVANPPDIFFVIVGFFKLFGARYIFDIHDLFVNTFESKYERHNSTLKTILTSILRVIERVNMSFADMIIVTNESYREYVVKNFPLGDRKVFVVRNAPPLEDRDKFLPNPSVKCGRKYLLVYFGVMGEDDGVDLVLRAMHHMKTVLHFTDFACRVIGPTDIQMSSAFGELRRLHRKLDLESHVEFTGYLPWAQVHEYLRTADVGLSPDPYTRQNDLSTMVKIMDYMSHGLPIVSFRLKENQFSAGDAAVYCETFDYKDFADTILRLLEDGEQRRRMSEIGFSRYKDTFNWSVSEKTLEAAYETIW